jgi:ribosomal protein S18 acetylase RimI-like enzyme
MGVRIRSATRAELEQAADVLEDAIAWAAERRFDSWTPGTFRDPGGWGRRVLREALEAGGLFLVERSRAVVGTVSLLPSDERFWPDAPPDGLYLHRFAVRRSASGAGVGTAALAWCEEEARRRGRRFLRLDCLSGNPGIRRYYEDAEFRHRGDAAVETIRLSLCEKDVSGSPGP